MHSEHKKKLKELMTFYYFQSKILVLRVIFYVSIFFEKNVTIFLVKKCRRNLKILLSPRRHFLLFEKHFSLRSPHVIPLVGINQNFLVGKFWEKLQTIAENLKNCEKLRKLRKIAKKKFAKKWSH